MSTDIDEFKVYTRRDSAAAVLKKLGIPARDYNMFIEKLPGDQHRLKLRAAHNHVKGVKEPVNPAAPAKVQERKIEEVKAAKAAAKAEKAAKAKAKSPAARIQELILEGLTNADIWKRVQVEFQLDDSKKHYPGWYRSKLRREGKIQ